MAQLEKQIDEMISIPIEYFLKGGKLPVDVFIKFSDAKFVRIGKRSDLIENTRLENYLQKSLNDLYVRKDEYQHFSTAIINEVELVCTDKSALETTKMAAISSGLSSILTKFEHLGFQAGYITESMQIARHAIDLTEKLPLDLMILFLEALPADANKRVMGTYYLSLMLAHRAGWTYRRSLENLSLAAFLHDLGASNLSPRLQNIAMRDMDDIDKEIAAKQVAYAVDNLSLLENVPSDVLVAIYQHRERSDGSGLPQGIRDLRISAMAKVVAVADEFVSLALSSNTLETKLTPTLAIRGLLSEGRNFLNREYLAVLAMLILENEPGDRLKKILKQAA